MNITIVAVAVAVCLCVAEGIPEARLTRKQQRPTRGFKNVEMMTARGFGKRARAEHEPPRRKFNPKGPLMVAYEFGKRSSDELNDEEEEIRVTRGTFKPNTNVLIARGYGKRQGLEGDEEVRVARGSFQPKSNVLIARGYGKRKEDSGVYGLDNFWENLETQEKDGQDGADEKTLDSIPLDWFVNEMINNPDFARSVVRKFIDLNQDGMLSSDELLRNL